MFPDDSPFRNPPASLHPKQLVAFDGLRFVFDMIETAYDQLTAALRGFSLSLNRVMPGQKTVAGTLHHAWSIVDNLYRLYQLMHDVPGLKRTPALEVYYRAIAGVEELRHGIQHLDDRLGSCALTQTPLFGSLRWFFTPGDAAVGGVSMVLVSGSVRPGRPKLINPMGRKYDVPIGLVTLDAFDLSLDLSDSIARTRAVAVALDKGVRKSVGPAPQAGGDLLIGVEIAFDREALEPPKNGG